MELARPRGEVHTPGRKADTDECQSFVKTQWKTASMRAGGGGAGGGGGGEGSAMLQMKTVTKTEMNERERENATPNTPAGRGGGDRAGDCVCQWMTPTLTPPATTRALPGHLWDCQCS